MKNQLDKAANQALDKAGDKTAPWHLRLLYWLIALLLAGISTLYFSSCSLADSLIVTGEKGTVTYYINPDTGEKTITYTPPPVKTQPHQK